MRANWYTGVEGLMTVIRVLPPDLYNKVMSGEGKVASGASVPGDTPGSRAQPLAVNTTAPVVRSSQTTCAAEYD